jgi:RNA polymerase sigma-70 factor (ECF subfamily)
MGLVITAIAQAMVPADLTLARRCAEGDRAAQRQVFDGQRERVHLILFRILGSNRDIEDLIQDAFIAIFRSLPNYRGEASLATWVDRITTRVALRYLSRMPPATVRLELVRFEVARERATLDHEHHLRQVALRLYALLDRLDPKYRVAYALHVIDERPLAEVATIMEVSTVAAKNRVWRARRMVQKRAQSDPVLREFLSRRGVR